MDGDAILVAVVDENLTDVRVALSIKGDPGNEPVEVENHLEGAPATSQWTSNRRGRDGIAGWSDRQNRRGSSPPTMVRKNERTFRSGWCSKRYGCNRFAGSSSASQSN